MDNGGRVGAESAAMSCVDSTPGRNLKAHTSSAFELEPAKKQNQRKQLEKCAVMSGPSFVAVKSRAWHEPMSRVSASARLAIDADPAEAPAAWAASGHKQWTDRRSLLLRSSEALSPRSTSSTLAASAAMLTRTQMRSAAHKL